ncbi:MAG: hypothetical protein MMC33_010054 [Icmadophila ericetorum]|nr:hypothetical protein [Icmadophila ericetorum]
MTTPHIIPQRQAGGGTISFTPISHVTPTILKVIKTIAEGLRTFDAAQQEEFVSSISGQATSASAVVQIRKPVNLHDLLNYLTSSASNVLKPSEPYDLTHPISHYFISSSHNTYLTGNQLYGDSSTDAYRNVLLRSCRCVEIDVWDGEHRPSDHSDEEEGKRHFMSHVPSMLTAHLPSHHTKPAPVEPNTAQQSSSSLIPNSGIVNTISSRIEPRVLHGHTLVREVAFRDVCVAIRETAFISSDLPLIVSLEVHAGPEQQEIMVEIMEQTWHGLLVVAGKDECLNLPSPAELRNKILVKVKHGDSSPGRDPSLQTINSNASQSDSDEQQSEEHAEYPKPKKNAMIGALCALGVYTQGYHFKSLTSPEASLATHVFSLSEKKLVEVHQSSGPTLFSHNRNFLMRAYPSGTRFSSSNLDASFHWAKGVQMVALNWQRWDAGMMLNEGMFAGSGGWVLKPLGFRGDDKGEKKVGSESQTGLISHKFLDLSIELFAAQDISIPSGEIDPERFRPYVKCELHIVEPEEQSGAPIEKGGRIKGGQYKKRSKDGTGIEPNFGGEMIKFERIPKVINELSFLRFKIQNDDIGKDTLAAWACIRLDRLQVGYRFIHLLDANGLETKGILFVNIQK